MTHSDVTPMDTCRIAAVGDICLGDHLLATGFGVRTEVDRRGLEHLLREVTPFFRSVDLVFGNLEGVLSDSGPEDPNAGPLAYRGPSGAGAGLRNAGFTLLNVANNHAGHYGIAAFQETVQVLSRAGIGVVGRRALRGGGCQPVICVASGQRLGFLGYSMVATQACEGAVGYADGAETTILKDIEKLRERVEHVVVSVHWGQEIINRPAASTIALARRMVESGAAVVLGHHPHVFQAVESYRQGLIFYSLGNFVFDCLWEPAYRQSAIAEISLPVRGSPDYVLHPVHISDRYEPLPLSGANVDKFQAWIHEISEASFIERGQTPEETDRDYRRELLRLERLAVWKKAGFVARRLHRTHPATIARLIRKVLQRVGS